MLNLRDLSVVYPNGARALHPTSLALSAGAFTVLLGPSGAGKSTLLRSLNGLVQPTSGEILVEGIGNIARGRNRKAHRRGTGMVFQQHQLIGRLTAHQNTMMGRLGFHSGLRTLLPMSAAEAQLGLDALERVGLLEFANRRIDQLSGGQQQRVGIARALVQQPRLILADEPVASLDPATADQVLGLMHSICKSDGLTAVVSLHQVDLARRFADRVIGLARGKVVLDGTAAQIDQSALRLIYGEPSRPSAQTASQSSTMEKFDEPATVAA
jgi:phosphonate transport system ATP-binding protein